MDNIQIITITGVVLIAVLAIVFIIKQPKKVKEWLLWAVIQAETTLGGGTGQVKLRAVYDLFVERYKVISFLVSFETFSKWVDVALEEMRVMLENNENVKALVSKK
jgi:small basic protein